MAEPIDNSNSNSNSNKEINNGSTESINENNSNNDEENKKKNKKVDPEIFSCLLQPMTSDSGPHYIGIRRLLLFRKARSGVHRRLAKKLGQFAKPPKHSGKQGNLLVDASVDDGFNLRVHSPICSRWTAGLPARTSFSSTASDNDSLRRREAEPAYSFVGMHCIFDQCKAAVTVLKFGYMSSDLLAYGASDGTLTVCTVTEPPSVIKKLEGHSKDVTDFDFSSNNQYIASASMDKTVRAWELPKGICIRVFNFSTGRIINKLVLDDKVTALDHDHTGHLIFSGDAQIMIHQAMHVGMCITSVDPHTGVLFRSHRYRSSGKRKYQVTTVWYWSFSLLAGGPVLLTCTQDGSFSFFSVALEIKGYLTLSGSLKLAPRVHSIRASFCPLLSLEKVEYIVAGSEDSNVYFYDLTRPKHTCVNKLQGHRFPVGDVAWNHGENLLATSDIYGIVILWKREKTRQVTICMYTALKKTTRNSWLVLNSIAYYFPVGKK